MEKNSNMNLLEKTYLLPRTWIVSGWRKYVIQYFLGSLIPTFIPIFYSVNIVNETVKTFLKENLSLIYKVLAPVEIQICLLILVYAVIPLFIKIMDDRLNSYKTSVIKNELEMQSLIVGISAVVREKRGRFYDCSKSGEKEPEKIFSQITKPLVQMNSIAKNIRAYFQKILEDSTLDVFLFKVREKKLDGIKVHTCDGAPRMSATYLKDNEIVKKCIQKAKIHIVEDIKDSVRRSRFNEGDVDKIKSVVCYPVKDGDSVAYLWIVSSNNCSFKKNREGLYKYVLQEFSERMILESYLDSMMEGVK